MAIPSPAGSTVGSTHSPTARVAFRPGTDAHAPLSSDGAWWPRSRSLADELPGFFAAWPPERGRIQRILYSPPDWDDHPHSVAVPGRQVKTGSFPRDDTHRLTVTLGDRTLRLITVIGADTSPAEARRIVEGVVGTDERDSPDLAGWFNEGGQ